MPSSCPARRLWFALSFLGMLLAVTAANGQERPQMPRENTRGSGTLKGLAQGLLHVETKEGDQLLLKVEAGPNELSHTGSADVSWLRPGMLVRFTARLSKKGQPLSDVSEVTVFTPRESSRIGIFTEAALGGGELFAEQNPAAAKDKDDSGTYLVSGQLAGLRGDKMTVAAGMITLKLKLAEDAKVQFDLADYRYAQPGDAVSFEGWYYPMAKNQIFARRLDITAAQPLTGEKKRPRPQPAKEASGQDEPAKEEPGKEKASEKPNGAEPAAADNAK
ncbi:MAG: hypothetical protein J5I93_26220 [Pirellulaceae bacterium]|nr:hypothetical protein [Pirellulaceae bacterium]